MRDLFRLHILLFLLLAGPFASRAQTFCCNPSQPLGMPNGPASVNTPQRPTLNVPNFLTSILQLPSGVRFYHASTQGLLLANVRNPDGTWLYPESNVLSNP